jgi:protein-S-isoprenylcysteine O-methyltransferase Ste14
MMIKLGSILGYLFAVIGLLYLIESNYVISSNPISIFVQLCSIGLMIWARLTFGMRSFHLTANATEGELVTTGPYKWLRHPIYASAIYFSFASVISHPFFGTIAAFISIFGGLFIKIILEEKSLLISYHSYAEYSKNTKRLIPFIY